MSSNKNLEERKNDFILKAQKKFGNKFDYSLVDYKGFKTPVKIICPIHGIFYCTPYTHTRCELGCRECLKTVYYTDEFIKKANIKFKFNFDYSKIIYKSANSKITFFCKKHNIEISQTPNVHLRSKFPCPECLAEHLEELKIAKNIKKSTLFINKANLKYNNKFDYSLVDYKLALEKVKIICPEHGLFEQLLHNHLKTKFGCPFCGFKNAGHCVGGYNEKLFKKSPDSGSKPGKLYYLKINDGEFYKIGITTTSMKKRTDTLRSKSKGVIKKIEIVWTFNDTLYSCFLKEQSTIDNYKKYKKYSPWSTELFSKDILPINPYESIIA